MARVKKAEREAVVAALMLEHDSVEAAAEAAVQALDEARALEMSKPANRPFVLLTQDEAHKEYICTFGPYATEAKALKAMKELCAPSKDSRYIAAVQRLYEVRA